MEGNSVIGEVGAALTSMTGSTCRNWETTEASTLATRVRSSFASASRTSLAINSEDIGAKIRVGMGEESGKRQGRGQKVKSQEEATGEETEKKQNKDLDRPASMTKDKQIDRCVPRC